MGAIEQLPNLPPALWLTGLSVLILVYLVWLAFYRLYLSPLAKFPGPKLAALSRWYEFYYDVALKGQYYLRVQEMHKKNGPIVRITPYELHINKSNFYEILYAKHHTQMKDPRVEKQFGTDGSIFSTVDPALHRLRRAPLNPMFSKQVIGQQEPMVQERMSFLSERLKDYHKSDGIVPAHLMWAAFSSDVVTKYAYGFHYNLLGSTDFKNSFLHAVNALIQNGYLFGQFPKLSVLLNGLPDSRVEAVNPAFERIIQFKRDILYAIRHITKGQDNQPKKSTIFRELLHSNIPHAEKTEGRLTEEAMVILGAGMITTAWALSVAVYYILDSPAILQKLRAELFEAIPDISSPDVFSLVKLEHLPYLRGCVREGLRLFSVSGRAPRLLKFPLQFEGWTIPPGTAISMNLMDVAYDETIYPQPHDFVPERWEGTPKTPDGESLEKYWVAFGKGPRACLGMNLAYMEVYIGLARFFREFQSELYETDITDIEMKHDFGVPSPRMDSKGIRLKITKVET